MTEEISGKKAIYKKWWFWVIVLLVVLAISGQINKSPDTDISAVEASGDEFAGSEQASAANEDEDIQNEGSAQVGAEDVETAKKLTSQLSTHIACVYAGERLAMVASRPDLGFGQDIMDSAQLADDVISSNSALAKALAPEVKSRSDGPLIFANANERMNGYMETMKSGSNADISSLFDEFAEMMTGECQS